MYNIIFKKNGFTLTEIVIAIGVLGLVIITICGVFVHGLYSIKKGKFRAAAIHVANQKFAEIEEADWGAPTGLPVDRISKTPADFGLIDGLTYVNPGGNIDNINWKFQGSPFEIEGIKVLANIEYSFYILIEQYRPNVKTVKVTVKWEELEGEKTLELCTLMSRKL